MSNLRKHSGQGEDSQYEKVKGQQQIYVRFGEDLEHDKYAEQGDAGNDWEHHGLFGRHGLNLLARLLF